jgi:hypothetical protein
MWLTIWAEIIAIAIGVNVLAVAVLSQDRRINVGGSWSVAFA